jgi:hypothetical protein
VNDPFFISDREIMTAERMEDVLIVGARPTGLRRIRYGNTDAGAHH